VDNPVANPAKPSVLLCPWPCVATAKLHSQGGGVADLMVVGLLESGGRRGAWPISWRRPANGDAN